MVLPSSSIGFTRFQAFPPSGVRSESRLDVPNCFCSRCPGPSSCQTGSNVQIVSFLIASFTNAVCTSSQTLSLSKISSKCNRDCLVRTTSHNLSLSNIEPAPSLLASACSTSFSTSSPLRVRHFCHPSPCTAQTWSDMPALALRLPCRGRTQAPESSRRNTAFFSGGLSLLLSYPDLILNSAI